MDAVLKRLSPQDGREIYQMLQEIPREENGFQNGMNGCSYEEFCEKLLKNDALSRETGLIDGWMVPQTTWWLYVDGRPVGMIRLRHFLTEALRKGGGHVGYAVRPGERGKGYGALMLKLMLPEAAEMGLEQVLLTVHTDNLPSQKLALKNGGVKEKEEDGRAYFWVPCGQESL